MISYQEALQIILSHAVPLQTEALPLLAALGKVSAADIKSQMQLPSFRNSAMDGFAVRYADIAPGKTLQFHRSIAAGDNIKTETDDCVQIMTGAMVPEPYDAVIPIEETTIEGDKVTFKRTAKLHENIRFPGEDVQLGQLVLGCGKIISAAQIMLLAALGVTGVKVYKLPSLHIFSTGKEITDNSSAALAEGQIYNSNTPYLLARCREENLTADYGGIIADDADAFEQAITTVKPNSVIITTGAVSKGMWDFIPESLARLGAKTHFHRVNIRPGKPVLFATLPNGNWFFGLPGNPISAAIGFQFFALPLIHALQNLPPGQPIMARLENNFTKKGNFRQFLKASLKNNNVRIAAGQESFKIFPLAESNAWVVLEEHYSECPAGTEFHVFPFRSSL